MARTTLLCCLLLAAAGGPKLLSAELLVGLWGQPLAFPPPHGLESADIARVLWSADEAHIAEAKPREKLFRVDLLPSLRHRLLLHPSNLSLEIRALREEDQGFYQVVVDTFSDPTSPRSSSYVLQVLGSSPWTAAGTSDRPGGQSRSTVGPQGVTNPHASDTTGQGGGPGQPPGSGGEPGGCGGQGHYCTVKGYLVATILGLMVVLVATIHLVTRDKATRPAGEVPVGLKARFEPLSILAPQGSSPWQ